jgi:hypothetical protein
VSAVRDFELHTALAPPHSCQECGRQAQSVTGTVGIGAAEQFEYLTTIDPAASRYCWESCCCIRSTWSDDVLLLKSF